MENPIVEAKNLLTQFEQAADTFAKKNGIEHLAGPQGRVLFFLAKQKDTEIFVKDIENYLHISKSVASNLVKRMARNGFVKTIPSRTDKRYKQIVLTELGCQKIKPLQVFHDEMQSVLLKDIDVEELKTVLRVTEQLRANLRAYRKRID